MKLLTGVGSLKTRESGKRGVECVSWLGRGVKG